jgi:hypothetical protein
MDPVRDGLGASEEDSTTLHNAAPEENSDIQSLGCPETNQEEEIYTKKLAALAPFPKKGVNISRDHTSGRLKGKQKARKAKDEAAQELASELTALLLPGHDDDQSSPVQTTPSLDLAPISPRADRVLRKLSSAIWNGQRDLGLDSSSSVSADIFPFRSRKDAKDFIELLRAHYGNPPKEDLRKKLIDLWKANQEWLKQQPGYSAQDGPAGRGNRDGTQSGVRSWMSSFNFREWKFGAGTAAGRDTSEPGIIEKSIRKFGRPFTLSNRWREKENSSPAARSKLPESWLCK